MESNINGDSIDITEIAELFFAVFTNKDGRIPHIYTLQRICIPEAIIIQKAGTTLNTYTIDAFASSRQKILTDGTLTDFEERETSEETKIFNNIAQRNSRYEKSGVLNGVYFQQTGTKLFLFVKLGSDWKISALVWEDDASA
jgi:hypothetical protein